MYNITIGRLPEDPEAQGVIRPDDGSWQLVIDKEGIPHLWVWSKFRPGSPHGEGTWIPVDQFLDDGVTMKMLTELEPDGEEITDPEQVAECEAEWERKKRELNLPRPPLRDAAL